MGREETRYATKSCLAGSASYTNNHERALQYITAFSVQQQAEHTSHWVKDFNWSKMVAHHNNNPEDRRRPVFRQSFHFVCIIRNWKGFLLRVPLSWSLVQCNTFRISYFFVPRLLLWQCRAATSDCIKNRPSIAKLAFFKIRRVLIKKPTRRKSVNTNWTV